MYTVEQLFQEYGHSLKLKWVAGPQGALRRIKVPEVHRPGLALTGFLCGYAYKRLLVLGKVEYRYLSQLTSQQRKSIFENLLSYPSPALILAKGYIPFQEMMDVCNENALPLFSTPLLTVEVQHRLARFLNDAFAPSITCHGTLVEVFGVGVLIQGDSSVGKSEAALGLVERGHRLVSDDVVKVRQKEGTHLEGTGAELTKHHMEIRGLGIINVAHLYGAVCVRGCKTIDLAVRLEEWSDEKYYDRVGLENETCDILGIKIPFYVLPVKPGRDVVLLLETLALNHRLKSMGLDSAREFNARLLETIAEKTRRSRAEAH